MLRLVLLCVLGMTLASPAVAQEREARARTLFMQGKTAYERGEYQPAYDAFREAFELSQRPELLYNIASALQGLKRPHDAGEALRSFLRLLPNDPDRPEIERRIASLEEAQRLIDRERELQRQKPAEPTPPPVAPPPSLSPSLSPSPSSASGDLGLTARVERDSERVLVEKRKRRTLIAVVSAVGGVLLIGGVVGLAVGLTATPSQPPYTMGSLGTIPGTR